MIKEFFPYAQQKIGFNKPPRVFLNNDTQNAQDPLGKTGYYDPQNKCIVLFIAQRHPKDILRSFSHELIHFWQDERGDFDKMAMGEENTEQGYAQTNPHLREMEVEAYKKGNLLMRDWEDSKKANNQSSLMEGYKHMDTNEEKRQRILTNMDENNTTKEHWIKRSEKVFDRVMEKFKRSIKNKNSNTKEQENKGE